MNNALFALLLIIPVIDCNTELGDWSLGGPCRAQHTLTPSPFVHGKGITVTNPPYIVSVLDQNAKPVRTYIPGHVYTVRLSGTVHFRGFVIQARLATKDGHIIGHLRAGEFLVEDSWSRYGIQIQECRPVFNNSITHINPDKKYLIEFKWKSDLNVGPVQFFITILQENTIHWARWQPKSAFLAPDKSSKLKGQGAKINQPPPHRSVDKNTEIETTRAELEKKQIIIDEIINPEKTDSKAEKEKEPLLSDSEEVAEEAENEEEEGDGFKPTGRRLTFGGGGLEVDTGLLSDHCSSEPCFNGANCTNLPEEDSFFCDCPIAFTGIRCDEINHCADHDCQNGAICKNEPFSFSCSCLIEWAGEKCNRHCPSYLCENGGTCVITEDDDYGCKCAPGWTGKRCATEIDECEVLQPCRNGGKCTDKLNGFECSCRDGWMGDTCHRPCQDIYQSCRRWKKEDRCEVMRPLTKFFDINCAVTCDTCEHKNRTIAVEPALPPVLEPFEFLIGRWQVNFTSERRFPIDFSESTSGHLETWNFAVAPVPMFGTPSINFSSTAVSNVNSNDSYSRVGFMTLNQRHIGVAGQRIQVAFMTTGNDGVTLIEEGYLHGGALHLKIIYSSINPNTKSQLPMKVERTISLRAPYLQETVTRTDDLGVTNSFTKYYYQIEKYLPW